MQFEPWEMERLIAAGSAAESVLPPSETIAIIETLGVNRELSIAQRSISLSEVRSPGRVAASLTRLRERRLDVADVFEFMSLTGVRWGEAHAIRVSTLGEFPLPQLNVERSRSDGYNEKSPKSWRGTRSIPLSPRAQVILHAHAAGESPDDHLFTNRNGG